MTDLRITDLKEKWDSFVLVNYLLVCNFSSSTLIVHDFAIPVLKVSSSIFFKPEVNYIKTP